VSKLWITLIVVVIALAAVVAGVRHFSARPRPVEWSQSFDQAASQAKQANKPLMVDFYTDWCQWCKKLDEDVYTDAQVAELSHEFVCVKVDAEQYRDVADRYKVNSYPTIIFLNSSGLEVSRIPGYEDAGRFAMSMQDALAKAK